MRYDRALRNTSSVRCLAIFRSIFGVTLHLVHSNSWDAQFAVPNNPRYDDWRQIWGSGSPRMGSNIAEILLSCEAEHGIVKNGSWEPLYEWQHMWLQDVMDIPLECHVCVVPRINTRGDSVL
ncbi:hypothetical protein TNCV_1174091 [Trichonephila clavipes]|nr:hypothetical protein TNCV_1174091 [Trichonephila clavipes]